MGKTDERNYLGVEVKLSPTDIQQLEAGTYVGDPVRRAVTDAAESDDREVQWETIRTWINKRPSDHNGITVRVFVKAPRRDNEPADD